MIEEKKYIAVFFDVNLPLTPEEAMQLRVDRKTFAKFLVEAVPDKIIELDNRYGALGSFKVVSRRSFINGSDLFLICDVKQVSTVSELTKWLNQQIGLHKINNIFYRFMYNEKLCVGQVETTPDFELLTIRPNLNIHDIGNGPGLPVIKKFRRE